MQRYYPHAPVAAVRWVLFFDPLCDCADLRLRLRWRGAGRETADDIQRASDPGAVAGDEAERHPDFRARLGQLVRADRECLGHHADNRPAFAVERHRLTDDVRIAAEMPLPEPVAHDHFGLDDAQVGSHGESAPAVRRRAENGEKVRGDAIRKDLDRGAIAGQVGAGILPAGQVGKSPALEPPIVQRRLRKT